jgi:WD40 repeat protein
MGMAGMHTHAHAPKHARTHTHPSTRVVGSPTDRATAPLAPQGRLLSCAWHPSGDALAVGGVDGSIHVLDATTGTSDMQNA